MLESRPTAPKPDRVSPWPAVVVYVATLALIAWAMWLWFG